MQTAEFYDAEARLYDQKRWGRPAGARLGNFHQRLVLSMLARIQGKKILEVGTGTGRFAATLAEKGACVTGVDISEKMLKLARKRCAGIVCETPVEFIQANVNALPLPSNYFNSVLCINTIQLLPSIKEALSEIGRLMKPRGRLLFNFPNLVSPYLPGGLLINWRGQATGKNIAGRRKSCWFTLGEIRSVLEECSFAIDDVRGQPLLPGNFFLKSFPKGLSHPRCFCPSLFISSLYLG